jgi:hypothetical protein
MKIAAPSTIIALRVMAIIATISHVSVANINSTASATNVRMDLSIEGENRDDSAAIQQQQQQQQQEFTIFAENAQCRCEAPWESLYNPSAQTGSERYYYNYSTIKIRVNDLVTIENVYVMKPDAMECSNTRSQQQQQQRPMTTTNNNNQGGGGQQRSSYFNNRQLEMIIGDVDLTDMMENQGQYVDSTMVDEDQAYHQEQEKDEPRDLQQAQVRYHGGGEATTARAPRTNGYARNYGYRPYGATTYGSYGYGKGTFAAVNDTHKETATRRATELIIAPHFCCCLMSIVFFWKCRKGQRKRERKGCSAKAV